jgi:hypothetical protein
MGMGQWPTDETIVLVVPGACDGIARSAFGIGVELHAELTQLREHSAPSNLAQQVNERAAPSALI